MKTRSLYFALLLVLIFILCGTVIAYMFTQTGYEENSLQPATVACQVVETFSDGAKTSIKIKNTGNIKAYLRLRLVSYWVDSEGAIAPKTSTMPSFSLNTTDWIAGANHTYYYKTPVDPNVDEGLTSDLLETGSSLTLAPDEDGCSQVVEIFAEAIQSEPGNVTSPPVSNWGVTLSGTTIQAVPTDPAP